jgi:DNA polymerase I
MIFFDIETNGIEDWDRLTDLNNVFVLCAYDTVTERMYAATTKEQIQQVLALMVKADYVVGHNIISFDMPCLAKLYGFRHPNVLDTLVMSRCIFPDIRENDFKRREFPSNLVGSHSLKAWGHRLGVLKDEHGEQETWEVLTPAMIEYCKQDVEVTRAIYASLMKTNPSIQMLELEHTFAKIIRKQQANGFPFNISKAEALCGKLTSDRVTLKQGLQELFGATGVEMKTTYWNTPDGKEWESKKDAIAKKYKAKDIVKGRFKQKVTAFNPNSRDQIAERLIAQGWKPETYEGKRPAINEPVLKAIGTPAALQLCEYLLISKRLGQLSEGNQAWLKLVKDDRIYGRVNTNGAVSGRCTHSNPNVAQVPAGRAPYGTECRELFGAPRGKVLVGADAAGLELRCLAHYLYNWDAGAYAREILNGDIHTANMNAAGLENRDQAKTFIYAFLYGAGDSKIGSIVGGNSADGKRLKASFFKKTPAIKSLVTAVDRRVKLTHDLKGLDGRILPCRSPHSALNLLLQSAGAVVMKQALVEFIKLARHPYELHANIHDEVQFSCAAEHADSLGEAFVKALAKAGTALKFNCPLDGEYKIGKNWAETH